MPQFETTARELFCGGAAGISGVFIGHPLDLIKIRLQTQPGLYNSAWSCFQSTVRNEGFRALYKGMSAPIFAQFFQNGLMFAGESFALSFLDPKWKHGNEGHDNSALNFFMAGSFGGMLQCLVLVPADVVKCKMQVMTDYRGGMRKRNAGANSNNPTEVPSPSSSTSTIRSSNEAPRHISSLECLTNVYKTEGLRGLYRGLGVTAIREVPAFGVYFFVYRYTVRLLNSPKDPKEQQHLPTIIESPSGSVTDFSDEQCEPVDSKGAPSALSILISGGLAGSISWICIYPFDVIKSHVQIMTPSTSSSVTAIGNKCSATVKGNNNGAVAASSAAKSESSAIAMALKLYRQHGIKVFFRGLGVTIVRAFPVNAMTFYMYELIKTKLMK